MPYEIPELDEVDAVLDSLVSPTSLEVYEAMLPYNNDMVAAASARRALAGDGGAGASSLTDLTDVTGDPGAGKGPVGNTDGTEFPLTRLVTQEDLEAILAAVAAVEFHDLELQNGCVNAGLGWPPLRYRLTLNNAVFLEGVITRDPPFSESMAGLVIATVPVEARPGFSLMFSAPSSGQNPARVDVQANGDIVFQGFLAGTAVSGYLSLCGINYSVGGPSSVVESALAGRFG